MNININLDKDFESILTGLRNQYGEEMADLNGLADAQISYTDFIDNFIDTDTVSDSSVDSSSNVSRHDMPTLLGEMSKPHKKILSYNKIYYEIKKKFGKETADEWFTSEYKGEIYLHSAHSASFVSYCQAYDLKDLAEQGLYFLKDGNFNPKPAKHLVTFVDFVKEFVSYASNRTAGAVGLPNLIPYMYYFWKKDVESGYAEGQDPEKFAKQNVQRLVYALNQPYTRDGLQSAFTNVSFYDHEYLMALFGGSVFPDGSLMVDEIEGIMQFQKWFLEEMAAIRHENMMTFPVSTISLLRQNGKFKDEEFAKWAVRHNMEWSDSNLFVDSSVTSLSNCCRLKNNIADLGYFNSIGGTALRVGSVKVSTINLARIALESPTLDDFEKNLRRVTRIDLIGLDRVRHTIRRNVEKGLLNNFTFKMLDFKQLYNTVGFIGIFECLKTYGFVQYDEFGNASYTQEGCDLGKRIFDVIRDEITKFRKEVNADYQVNIEQTPGESAASKLMRKDKFFYGDRVVDDLPLYGNQFMPLGVKSTFKERVRVQALFDSYCNGGSILHANIDKPFDSFDKAWEMTNYIADAGVTYFAFNTKIQACDNNHAFYGQTCPVCGKKVATEYTRIVGFYTPVNTWSKERKEEYNMRRWTSTTDMFGD